MRTAWRIDGTLREFPKFPAVNVWFEYPVHRADETGVLKDIDPDKADPKKNLGRKKSKEENSIERKNTIEIAFEGCQENGLTTVKQLSEVIGKSVDTVYNYIDEHGGFWRDKEGVVGRKQVPKN
jgi:RecA-family ATPase